MAGTRIGARSVVAQRQARRASAGEHACTAPAAVQVIELIEQLRAQHVFPTQMLRLHAHEWDAMLDDASGGAIGAPVATWDADH